MRQLTTLIAASIVAGCSAAPVKTGTTLPTTTTTTVPSPTAKPNQPKEKPKRPLVLNPTIGSPSAPETFPPFAKVSSDSLAKLVKSQNQVSSELYARVSAGNENLVMSPTSISLAFGMVYAGARGNTANQMAATFQYNLPQSEIHAAFGTALRQWTSKQQKRPYELAVANRLFGQSKYDFTRGFLDVTGDHYLAEIERLNFFDAPEPSRLHINDWVDAATNHRIKDLLPVDSIKRNTALVLTNAVFFKGKWKQAFPKTATKDTPFTTPTRSVTAKMMNLTGQHKFAHVGGVKMLQMAYRGDDLAMQLVLPDDKNGLAALEAKLVDGQLDKLSAQLGSHEVIVSLPRFTIAPTKSMALSEVLDDMGMTDVWLPAQSDLSGMAHLKPNERLYIQEAFHKAFVEVEEVGTEAAAATAVVVGSHTTSVKPPPPPPKRFNADHPFMFVIRDLNTNAILFIGRVNDPTK